MELIPAIDLLGGRCVRLLHGDFERVTYYRTTAETLAQKYVDAGARTLHVVDLDGARRGRPANAAIIRALAGNPRLTVQVGGGLREAEQVAAILAAGAGRAVVGSTAIHSPQSVIEWAGEYGGDKLVLALDVRFDDDGAPRLASHGWQRQQSTSLWELLEVYAGSGIRHVLCTDIGRDGAMSGPNTALYAECCARFPELAFQASGGVRRVTDLTALAATGVVGAISGKALLEDELDLGEAKPFLPNA
jgi:phosphoribosylformimino-5-aminoimidazole carboxamide ribotide isomerase